MKIIIVILVLVNTMLIGCQGHCIKIGGNYKEYSGEVTWCLDQKATEAAGQTVLSREGYPEQTAVLLTGDKMQGLLEALLVITTIKKVGDNPKMQVGKDMFGYQEEVQAVRFWKVLKQFNEAYGLSY